MRKYIFVLGLLFCIAATGQDERNKNLLLEDNQFIVAWDIAIPTTNDFLDKTSFNGVKLEYRRLLNTNIAWGVSSGWNSYRQKVDQQLYEAPDGSRAVYTDMIRRVHELPITLNGYYFLDQTADIKPYAGLGLGALYSLQEAYFNVYEIDEHNWGFLVRPEIGVQYEINYLLGVQAYASYSYATNKNDSFRIDNLSHISIGVGLYWGF